MTGRKLSSVLVIFGGGFVALLGAAYMAEVPLSFQPEAQRPAGGQEEQSPSRLTTGSESPLVVEEAEVDLGAVKGPVAHRFRYSNRGAQPLEIKNVAATCSCIASKPDRTVLRPGESGSVTLETDVTQKEPGPHRFVVTIHYECGTPMMAKASIKVAYVPDLRLLPKVLEMTVTEGRQAATSFALIDYRSAPLKVLGIRTSSPEVQVGISERPLEYLPGWRYVFDVRYSDPPGETRTDVTARVFVETSDPNNPLLPVGVAVRRLERLRVAPSAVTLNSSGSAVVVVRDSLGEGVVIGSCETGGVLAADFTPDAEPVKRITLSTPQQKRGPGEFPATVWIKVKKPCERSFPITVSLAP